MATVTLPRILDKKSGSGAAFKRRTGAAPKRSVRDYTYTTIQDCGADTATQSAYVLRGAAGNYNEDLCGNLYDGRLEYVEDVHTVVDGLAMDGHVYNGTDAYGSYGYFFTAAEVAQLGSHVVLIAAPHAAGQPYVADGGWLATRTSP